MDPYEDARMAAILAAGNPNDGLASIPRPGRNPEFDAHVHRIFGEVDPEHADVRELRRAAWRTWKTVAPTVGGSSSRHLADDNEDDELQRALALSAQDQRATQGSSRNTPIVLDDDDEEMQRVIAMSTTKSEPPSRREDPMDEEERMMKEAIAASLAVSERPSEAPSEPDPEPEDDMDAAIKASLASFEADQREQKRPKTESASASRNMSPAPSCTTADDEAIPPALGAVSKTTETKTEDAPQPVGLRLGGLQIDRAQMERDRIARQAARMGTSVKPEVSKPVESRNAVASSSKGASSSNAASSYRAIPSSSKPSSSNGAGRTLPPPLPRLKDHPIQSAGPFPRDAAGEYYVDGELRHVSLRIGRDSTAKIFSPRDVFGKHSEMSLLILSSFVWDNPWIDRDMILPTPDLVPTIRICRPPTNNFAEMREKQGKLQIRPDGEVWSYPSMDGRQGSEHMKFAWIFYKTGRLRVAIFTANMVDYDWDRIENTVFIQDFLPTKAASKPDPESLPDFPDQFRSLFNHLKLSKAVKMLVSAHPCGKDIPLEGEPSWAGMCRYDWSRVQVRLVMSVSGKYSGFGEMERFGLGRLGKIIREEGWTTQSAEKLAVEYQGSSLGSYSSKWLNDFYHCCQGKDMPTVSRFKDDKKMPPIKVIFPSLATVDKSVNGRPGGGTMFCGSGFKPATASLFHDANSKRGGVLMHTKMIIALFEPMANQLGIEGSSTSSGKRKASEITENKDDVGGWVYVGSHNFSAAAWGTLNFTNSPPTLNITNYELGIVFPLPRSNAHAMANSVAAHQRPPRPYSKSDVPWSQKDHLN